MTLERPSSALLSLRPWVLAVARFADLGLAPREVLVVEVVIVHYLKTAMALLGFAGMALAARLEPAPDRQRGPVVRAECGRAWTGFVGRTRGPICM